MALEEQHRAQSPRPPALTPAQEREENRRRAIRAERLGVEERSLLRGVILLAIIVLIASLARAGFDRLFVPGWWRQW